MSTGPETPPVANQEESVTTGEQAEQQADEIRPPGDDVFGGPEAPLEGELVDEDENAGLRDDDAEARVAAAEARADENWDRLLRLQAEMENQRKRAQRDVTNARKFALEGIVNDLLPVRDSLEMGMAAAAEESATATSIRQGSELTLKMLAAALEKHNIVAIDPVGEKFNPEFHQAMSMQEIEGAAHNTIVSVMQKGYTLNDRLVRPALVMVAK